MHTILLCYKDGKKELVQERDIGPYLRVRKFIQIDIVEEVDYSKPITDTIIRFENSGKINDLDLHIYKEM